VNCVCGNELEHRIEDRCYFCSQCGAIFNENGDYLV
jgi:hypothetical protein